MSNLERVGDLEITQDITFQERAWRVQRIGWVVMALALLATLAGLCGSGFLSRTVAAPDGGAGSIELQYNRFTHQQAPTTLDVHIDGSAVTEEEVHLQVERQYLEQIQVEQITPVPESEEVAGQWLTYTFRVAQPGQSLDVTFHIMPLDFGRLRGRLRLPEEEPLRFSQFVYP